MSASERLGHYVTAFAARLQRRQWLRALVALAAAALGLTVAGSWIAIRYGFAPGLLTSVRLVLLAVLLALVLVLIAQPLQRLRRRPTRAIERLSGDFDGRLDTFATLGASGHPLRELLADDALAIAARHPPERHIAGRELAIPAALAAILALALVLLGAVGPGLYRDGARAIWAGWLIPTLTPAQRIMVEPGDEPVRRGGTVVVRSTMVGFSPSAARLHARTGGGAWQEVEMTPSSKGFTFTFFSVRDPVSYYVSAAGLRSPTFALKVVDLPNVASLKLTYHYPAWTHRPPQTANGGDIAALAGTTVDLDLRTDTPLAAGELVLDQAAQPLTSDGRDSRGSLEVRRDARYYLAARIGGERVRLTADYLIKVVPDQPPQVHIKRPGRDYGASSIEEVSATVQASDDYGLEALELHYSVNGGAWRAVPLTAQGLTSSADYVFALEALKPDGAARALEPGDLISYYALARDHAQLTRTDLYFIDVQPFDRRFSQAQASDGGAGGGDGEQQEITQRQRQILASTWNLLRERNGSADRTSGVALHDNAQLLSTLQKQLEQQAQSLAARTQARELTASDARIGRFVASMRRAAAAMEPAAERLSAIDLPAAIGPEQQALQSLMQAESQFTDVQVAMQHGDGGASQADHDLDQIYELEMDLKKNQYESGHQASPEARDRTADELARRLAELARREQQLAEQTQHTNQPTPEQRWQQDSLRREAEGLRAQLNQLQQRAGNQSGGSRVSPGSASGGGTAGSGATASASPSAAQLNSAPGVPPTESPLARELEQAIQAMDQAGTAMRGDSSDAGARARAATAAAQHALAGVGTELARERSQAMRAAIGDMAANADQLYAHQAAVERELQSAYAGGTRGASTGLTPSQQDRLAQQKQELSAGVQQLQQRIGDAARQYRPDSPEAAQALQQASHGIDESELRDRLDLAGQFIAQGRAAYVAPSESASTEALRALREQLAQAQAAAGASTPVSADALADELGRVRALREQLQRLADASRALANGGAGQAASTSGGGGNDLGGGASPGGQGSRRDLAQPRAGYGAGGGLLADNTPPSPEAHALGPASDSRQVAASATSLLPLLRARGASAQDLQSIDELSRQLGAIGTLGAGERGEAMAAQLQEQVALLEQLELRLARSAAGGEQAIRAAVNDPVSDAYKAAVAEYYRQLSRE